MAEVLLAAPQHVLDVEALSYAALQECGIPTRSLCDYAAVPVMQGCWQGREGMIVLALLRLEGRAGVEEGGREEGALPPGGSEQGQQPAARPASACLLLHAAAASGDAGVVEVLRPPYPWQGDLSSDLVQQLALAGE